MGVIAKVAGILLFLHEKLVIFPFDRLASFELKLILPFASLTIAKLGLLTAGLLLMVDHLSGGRPVFLRVLTDKLADSLR